MHQRMKRGLFAVAVAAASIAPVGRGPSASADEPSWEARLQQKSGTVVSVKFVLKTHLSFQGQSQDDESNREVRGVVVDASGLVMLANSSLEGDASGVLDEHVAETAIGVEPQHAAARPVFVARML